MLHFLARLNIRLSNGFFPILPIQKLRGQTLRWPGLGPGRHLMTARLVCFICTEMDAQPQIKHSKLGWDRVELAEGAQGPGPWELRNFQETFWQLNSRPGYLISVSGQLALDFGHFFSEGTVSVFNRNANRIPFHFDESWHWQGNPIIKCVRQIEGEILK